MLVNTDAVLCGGHSHSIVLGRLKFILALFPSDSESWCQVC